MLHRYIAASDIFLYEIYQLTSTALPSATVNVFIDDAESLVNGRLAKRYTVPFTSTSIPFVVQKVVKDFGGYYCLEYIFQYQNRNLSDWVQQRYDASKELLEQLYNDEIRLVASLPAGGVGVLEPNLGVNLKAKYTTFPPIVNMDSPYNWGVSKQLSDNIADRRQAAD